MKSWLTLLDDILMYCYRFPDRATFLGLCDALSWLSEVTEESPEAVLMAYTLDRAVDEIGPITIIEGTYDEDGNELTAPVIDNGHHVNYQGVHPAEFDAYVVLPECPKRRFAGVDGAQTPYAPPAETDKSVQ